MNYRQRLGTIRRYLDEVERLAQSVRELVGKVEDELDGVLPGVHGRCDVGAQGRNERGPAGSEGAARRARDGENGSGPVPDQDAAVTPADRRGAQGELRRRGHGGSPDDLSTAESSLKIDHVYDVIGGPHAGKRGRLTHVEVTGFGHMICTLAVEIPLDVAEDATASEGIRVRASDLRA